MAENNTQPVLKQPHPRFFVPLILLGIFLLVAAIVIFILGKLVLLGILALLSSIFTLGSQVARQNKL